MFPITVEDEVSFINKYSLIATINHSGNLNRGHYCAFIRDLNSMTNDKLVLCKALSESTRETCSINSAPISLAMTNSFLMLKKGLSAILHHTSVFYRKV